MAEVIRLPKYIREMIRELSDLFRLGVMAAVGASNLQYVDLNSSRNLVVFGISLFWGLSFPSRVVRNFHLIQTDKESLDQVSTALLANMFMCSFHALVMDTDISVCIPGNDGLDQVLNALLANNMFMGCFPALVLDNVLPGTDYERGIKRWREVPELTLNYRGNNSEVGPTTKTYDLPFGMRYIRRTKFFRKIPFCQNFTGFDDIKSCANGNDLAEEVEVIDVKRDQGNGSKTNLMSNDSK